MITGIIAITLLICTYLITQHLQVAGQQKLEIAEIKSETERFTLLREETVQTVSIGGQDLLLLTNVSSDNESETFIYRWVADRLVAVKAVPTDEE